MFLESECGLTDQLHQEVTHFGRRTRYESEIDHAWPTERTESEDKLAEVSVEREKEALVGSCALQDFRIACAREVLGDRSNVEAGRTSSLYRREWNILIREEAHAADPTRRLGS